jgi:hypothetical protein
MIQLNLLPDVKLEYIKAERSRRLFMSVSILASTVTIGILVLLLLYGGLQKKHLHDLSSDISKEGKQLQSEPKIDKILTVQNQLQSLTALHASKPAVSRLFDYLNQLTPTQISITNFTTDFTQQTATITGTADALSSVNKYIDTMKFTTYTTDTSSTSSKAFSNVVLTSFGVTAASGKGTKPANFTITLGYDKPIFDITQKVSLSVPQISTTRASLENPTALFEAGPQAGPQGGQ